MPDEPEQPFDWSTSPLATEAAPPPASEPEPTASDEGPTNNTDSITPPARTNGSAPAQQEPDLVDWNAEEHVLGAILLAGAGSAPISAQLLADLTPILGDGSAFERESNRHVYRAAVSVSARGEPTDVETIGAELERSQQLKNVTGGTTRILELAMLAPSTSNAPFKARIVADLAQRRRHKRVLDRATRQNLEAGLTDDALAELRTIIDTPGIVDTGPPAVFTTLREFVKLPFPPAESLVGAKRDGTNLLPARGWVMAWGPAGAAKTSIVLDLAFHAVVGRKWLHYPIQRPLKLVLIVNEGIPGGLQDKVSEKIDAWAGDVDLVKDNIAMYVSPWGEFSFRNQRMSDHLQHYARDFGADYIIGDPLHTLGAIGSGTPQETEEFKHCLRAFGVWDWIGILTAHHANKAGMVSGDWTRHPDTVIHLEKDGKNPATKFTVEKARPGDPDELGVPQLLEWVTETKGYKYVPIERKEKVPDEALLAAIRESVAADPGLRMSDVQRTVTGDDGRIRDLVKAEIAAGRISNTGRANAYALWPGDDPSHSVDRSTEWNSQTTLEDPETSHSVDPDTESTE